jgi:hypothetical protein
MIRGMVEYGGGIHNGPAGQVGGGGGTPDFGSSPDLFASVSHVVNDAVTMVTTAPREMILLGIVIFFVGLIVLKRAF